MSFSLFPFVMKSQPILSFLQSGRGMEEEHCDDVLSIRWYFVQVWYKQFEKKIPLDLEERVLFSVNNNPRKNTWTGLLEELDRISEFRCSCFFRKSSLYIGDMCWGVGWNKPQLATALSFQCLLCYWESIFPSPPQHKFPDPFSVV